MSTKFAIRPAVRKRPWICKRSPPCLKPPSFPPSLLATFWLKYNPGPDPPGSIAGSLILKYFASPNKYYGAWSSGLDNFNCTFQYDIPTRTGHADSAWSAGVTSDYGAWPKQTIRLPPILLYRTGAIQSHSGFWVGTLTITS